MTIEETTMAKKPEKQDCGCGALPPKDWARQIDTSLGAAGSPVEGSVLGREDSQRTWLAFSKAVGEKLIDRDAARRFASGVDDLAQLEAQARGFLAGDAAPESYLELLASEMPWPGEKVARPSRKAFVGEVLGLSSPGAPLLAAWVASGGDRTAVARAISAYLRRAEAITRVVRAARGFETGGLGLEGFATIARWSVEVLAYAGEPGGLVKIFADGPSFHEPPLPFPLPDIDGGIIWPRRPPLSQWLDPANQAWLHCSFNFQQELLPLPDLPKRSPPGGVAEPAVICANQAAGTFAFSLNSPNVGFGKPESWTLSVGGRPVTITKWTANRIEGEVSGLAPGCAALEWGWATNWAPPIGAFDACREALRIPIIDPGKAIGILIKDMTKLWQRAGEITVIGPDILHFSADGVLAGTTIEREACTDVRLAWQVDPKVCVGRESLISVTLLRDGAALRSGLSFSGVLDERLQQSASYVLRVEGRDLAGNVCSVRETQELRVERFARLVLGLPSEVSAAMPGRGSLRISCSAPSAGLTVSLTANPASNLVIPASVTIPFGDNEATFPVGVGTSCGQVTVTASATGHRDGSASTCALLPPDIVSLSPTTPLPACDQATLTLQATCVSAPPELRVTAIGSGGQRIPGRVSVSGGPASCVRSSTFSVALPPLEPGSYALEIADRGGVMTAVMSVVVVADPRIVSAPSSIRATARCPPPSETVRVRVIGADAVRFTYRGTAQTVQRPAGGAACGEWTASTSIDVARVGELEVVPLLGTLQGGARRIPVNLYFPNHVVGAVVLRGSDSSGKKRSATVERGEITPTSIVFQPDGSLGEQQERRFPIDECAYVQFRISRAEIKETDSSGHQVVVASYYEVTTSDYLGHPDAPDSPVMEV